MKCGDCKFFKEIDPGRVEEGEESFGRCQRYAPRPAFKEDPDWATEWVWPHVNGDDWCGEFVDRDRH